MEITDKVYGALVNRVPGIRERYKRKRNQVNGIGRGGAWMYLLGLNVSYYLFRNRRLEWMEKYPYYESKLLYAKGSESSLSKRKSPEAFAGELAAYDVISFDVFDTLIFRLFSEPTDVFFLLGEELGYMDFKRIRMEMEWKARKKKYKKDKHSEVNLEEIYALLSEETGINKDRASIREVQLEQECCFANPYMLQTLEALRKLGKRVILTSDMYLNAAQIKELLGHCGYGAFDACYVSCEYGASKSEGTLYEEVHKRESREWNKKHPGETPRFVHVGDNYLSDVEHAKQHGFASRHYVNVNAAGAQYRAEDMSAITGGLYRGIVNAHIHNGLYEYSREYEYGYIYGGLFVTGYCQFIHAYAKEHRIEKLLFLARDGDVLIKAYRLLYPEESGRCEYVYWSRLAALKLSAGIFKYDYFRRFLYHKVNQKYSIRKILSAMELEGMLDMLCGETSLQPESGLTDRNVERVKKFLVRHWEEVLDHYKEQSEGGRLYYGEVLEGCKKAAAVDIGWAGSGAISLEHLVNQVWGLDCEITGIIAGTNTCHSAEPDMSETFLQSGKLVSYLYSQRENRDLWKLHDAGKNHNLYWELLLDAPMGSLKGFYLDGEGKWECRFKEGNADGKKIEEIQEGILTFVGQYREVMEKFGEMAKISGRDGYAPMVLVQNEGKGEFMEKIAELMDDVNVG